MVDLAKQIAADYVAGIGGDVLAHIAKDNGLPFIGKTNSVLRMELIGELERKIDKERADLLKAQVSAPVGVGKHFSIEFQNLEKTVTAKLELEGASVDVALEQVEKLKTLWASILAEPSEEAEGAGESGE